MEIPASRVRHQQKIRLVNFSEDVEVLGANGPMRFLSEQEKK